MAKVILISANPATFPFPVYPIGIGHLAEACLAAGHEAVQIDDQLDEFDNIRDKIRQFDADLIGLSIRNIDNNDSGNYFSYVNYYCDLIKKLRSITEKPIVLGGSGFSLYSEALMRLTGADYGIVGEGEQELVALLNALEKKQVQRRGQLFTAEKRLRSGKFHAPLRCQRMVEYYLQFGGIINVQSKRGCPYECSYCTYPLLEGHYFRYRDLNDVIDECKELVSHFGADYIYFADSVFNDPKGFYLEIAEQFVRQEIKCKWTGFFRPNSGWRKEDVRLLKSSGLDCVEWGTDCSTDSTLLGMQKGFDWSAVVETNNVFANEGIANGHYIIFGGPGETQYTVIEGLKNLGQLKHSVIFAVNGIRIIPETHIYKTALAEGVVSAEWDGLKEKFYLSPELNWENVDSLIRKSFDGDICRIYPPTGDEKLIAALHRRGLKGPLWDLMLKARRRKR